MASLQVANIHVSRCRSTSCRQIAQIHLAQRSHTYTEARCRCTPPGSRESISEVASSACCQQEQERLARRNLVLAVSSAVGLASLAGARPARANPAQSLLKGFLRPEIDSQQALTMLIDARATLAELQVLAKSPRDSKLRFDSRVLLPGMAKRLREVGMAAPIVAALTTGADSKEREVSEDYGGTAKGSGAADPVYVAIGKVVTISGRTISKMAQFYPELSADAMSSIDTLLAQVPNDVLDKARQSRGKRATG